MGRHLAKLTMFSTRFWDSFVSTSKLFGKSGWERQLASSEQLWIVVVIAIGLPHPL